MTTQPLRPNSFDDFYRSRSTEVYRTLAVVLRDADLAREAADEAMTRAYARWRTVQRYENPTGWVYRVALNWSRSRLRRRRREVLVETPHVRGDVDPAPDPDLDRAVGELPLHHREVVVLRYLLDMSQLDIANYLDIPIGTVKSRLHRALDQLRKELEHDA